MSHTFKFIKDTCNNNWERFYTNFCKIFGLPFLDVYDTFRHSIIVNDNKEKYLLLSKRES